MAGPDACPATIYAGGRTRRRAIVAVDHNVRHPAGIANRNDSGPRVSGLSIPPATSTSAGVALLDTKVPRDVTWIPFRRQVPGDHKGVKGMFSIRIISSPVTNEDGRPDAGGELVVGDARLHFRIDLGHWTVGDYQRQWRAGMARLVHTAESSALVTAYPGPGNAGHVMWAVWKARGRVYVQQQVVLTAEVDVPFNPREPYAHVGEHIPAAEHGLPIPEWSTYFQDVHTAMLETPGPRSRNSSRDKSR